MTEHNVFAHYTQLLAKVDDMFDAAFQAHREAFQCGAGCYTCCQPGLTVTNIEARRIQDWLSDKHDLKQQLNTREGMLNSPDYCPMLDASGRCVIYDVRPLICRSHGMPVSWKEDGVESRDCCPLNFKDTDLSTLAGSSVLSLDTINVILSVIDRAYDEANAGVRVKVGDLGVDYTREDDHF